jgi:hypothetical protein
MLKFSWALLLAMACNPTGSIKIGGADDTGRDGDADTDTDSDTDADSDADSDSDTDTGTPPDVEEPVPDLVVDCKGSGDYELIQDAIDAAVSPARIGVKKCTYKERIDYLGKQIDLYGIDGSAVTIIDGEQGGTVVDIETRETGWTRFAGFTVKGGYDPEDGAGMEVKWSMAELHDVVFEDNEGLHVVRSLNSAVDMRNVVISGNDVSSEGQAIWVDGGNINLDESVVDCDGGAQAIWHHVALVVADSEINCDSGYGVHDYHGEDRIMRSTVYGGIAGMYSYDTESTDEEPDSPSERFTVVNSVIGGGSIGADVRYMTLDIQNSVFYGDDSALSMTACSTSSVSVNNVFAKAACGITGDQAFTDSYSAYWDNTANGCGVTVNPEVTADPQFASWPDDVSLDAGSPLINAGTPALDDTDGSRSDIGRYGGPAGGW